MSTEAAGLTFSVETAYHGKREDSRARAQNPGVSFVDSYRIPGLLPEPEDGLSDITELYLAAFRLLPPGKRVFIQTVQQINGWRDLPKTISSRIPTR